MKNYDVTALGELLVDFTENGLSAQGNMLLEANAGGAPCNVLAMLQKLGKRTAFIGKVGDDIFGRMLAETVKNIGLDTANLVVDKEVFTTLAFVHTLPDGDREFSFARNPGADMTLKTDEINTDIIKSAKIFHFGTLSSTHEQNRAATRFAVDVARKSGTLVSFDPNLRPPLWKSLDAAKAEIEYGLSKCDILKISDNEIEFFANTKDYDTAMRALVKKYDIKLAFATFGKHGSRAYYGDIIACHGGFAVNAVETTGAGDAFCGAALKFILDHGINALTKRDLEELLTFANAAAALVTTRKGALKAMPNTEEIRGLIKKTE